MTSAATTPSTTVEEDFVDRVDELTDGEGVELVLDGVGGDVFHDSLDALTHFGRLVFYGVASGEPPQADMTELLFDNKSLIGFHLGQASYRDPGTAMAPVPELIQLLASGEIAVQLGESFPLAEAAGAHQHIEDRESRGKVLLRP